jgi:hypothetical protein
LLLLLLLFLTIDIDPVADEKEDKKGGETEPKQSEDSKIVHADWQIGKAGHFIVAGFHEEDSQFYRINTNIRSATKPVAAKIYNIFSSSVRTSFL